MLWWNTMEYNVYETTVHHAHKIKKKINKNRGGLGGLGGFSRRKI